jgi:glycosyltransferase involved in cell wall biosynthesis
MREKGTYASKEGLRSVETERIMLPLVTIAIPTLGRLELLRLALVSARNQTYETIEILIGDNSASSEVASALKAIRDSNSGVRVITQKTQLSMADHWSALADAASGEFFILLADDDLLEPEFTARLVDLSLRAPDAGVLFADHWIIDESDKVDSAASDFYSRENHRTGLPAGLVADSAVAVWNSSVPICSAMTKTALVREYRFNGLLNTPEIEFFARLAGDEIRFAYEPARLARYRVHGGMETRVAGLHHDRLFRALAGIVYPPSAETARRNFLGNLGVTAVNEAFIRGDLRTAHEIFGGPNYPRSPMGRPVMLLQLVCANLPSIIAPLVFRTLYFGLRKIVKPRF